MIYVIFCDTAPQIFPWGGVIFQISSTRWTVDPAEKEVYIERSTGVKEAFAYSDSVKELKISEVQYSSAKGEVKSFRFDTSKLDSSWVVTDLREE